VSVKIGCDVEKKRFFKWRISGHCGKMIGVDEEWSGVVRWVSPCLDNLWEGAHTVLYRLLRGLTVLSVVNIS